MEFSPKAVELTTLLESGITKLYTNFQEDEIRRVVSAGGIYGLNKIQVREIVEFSSGVKGITLNFKNKNVGIIVFDSDTAIEEGDFINWIYYGCSCQKGYARACHRRIGSTY